MLTWFSEELCECIGVIPPVGGLAALVGDSHFRGGGGFIDGALLDEGTGLGRSAEV